MARICITWSSSAAALLSGIQRPTYSNWNRREQNREVFQTARQADVVVTRLRERGAAVRFRRPLLLRTEQESSTRRSGRCVRVARAAPNAPFAHVLAAALPGEGGRPGHGIMHTRWGRTRTTRRGPETIASSGPSTSGARSWLMSRRGGPAYEAGRLLASALTSSEFVELLHCHESDRHDGAMAGHRNGDRVIVRGRGVARLLPREGDRTHSTPTARRSAAIWSRLTGSPRVRRSVAMGIDNRTHRTADQGRLTTAPRASHNWNDDRSLTRGPSRPRSRHATPNRPRAGESLMTVCRTRA